MHYLLHIMWIGGSALSSYSVIQSSLKDLLGVLIVTAVGRMLFLFRIY